MKMTLRDIELCQKAERMSWDQVDDLIDQAQSEEAKDRLKHLRSRKRHLEEAYEHNI